MAYRQTKRAKRINRETRLKKAREVIIAHPNWGKDRVNIQVKRECGIGLRRIDVAKLKQELLLGRPVEGRRRIERLITMEIAPHISREQLITIGFEEFYHKMRASGFLDFEIREFMKTGSPELVFRSKPFRAMLRSRLHWLVQLKRKGWTKSDAIKAIQRYYAGAKRSPFDFLRAEYKPPLRVGLKDYQEAAQKRAERKTQKRLYKRGRQR